MVGNVGTLTPFDMRKRNEYIKFKQNKGFVIFINLMHFDTHRMIIGKIRNVRPVNVHSFYTKFNNFNARFVVLEFENTILFSQNGVVMTVKGCTHCSTKAFDGECFN